MPNAIIDPREYATGPWVSIPRRGAVDFNGTGTGRGRVKSDYWHRGLPSEVVARNHTNAPGIRFHCSDYVVGVGVALSECECTEGIAMPTQSIFAQLPRNMQGLRSGVLLIRWPGYAHLNWCAELILVHANGAPLTVAHMASQIAYLWRGFFQKHSTSFCAPGLALGANQITFNHLCLHQIYTRNGEEWEAEISYVKNN